MNIRLSEQEEKLYKDMAAFHGMSLSAYVRETMNEAIEDYLDARDAEKAYEEYLKNPVSLSHEEFWEDLD